MDTDAAHGHLRLCLAATVTAHRARRTVTGSRRTGCGVAALIGPVLSSPLLVCHVIHQSCPLVLWGHWLVVINRDCFRRFTHTLTHNACAPLRALALHPWHYERPTVAGTLGDATGGGCFSCSCPVVVCVRARANVCVGVPWSVVSGIAVLVSGQSSCGSGGLARTLCLWIFAHGTALWCRPPHLWAPTSICTQGPSDARTLVSRPRPGPLLAAELGGRPEACTSTLVRACIGGVRGGVRGRRGSCRFPVIAWLSKASSHIYTDHN